MEKGNLYIVATPIGNLDDITLRAVQVLKSVDLVAAEDTRHSRKLLTHLGISKPLTSYFDHNKIVKGAYIIEKLEDGSSVALISDAGTPCISDPGYQLVRDAVEKGISVIPVPGPSAFVAALSVCGIESDSFTFEGFLPNKAGKRRSKLMTLINEQRLLVFHESPKRLSATLCDMLEVLGDRKIVIAREITKIHEEFIRGQLSEIIYQIKDRQLKGEVVILVSPLRSEDVDMEMPVAELLEQFMCREKYSLKDSVKKIVEVTGLPRSVVYREALTFSAQKQNCVGNKSPSSK